MRLLEIINSLTSPGADVTRAMTDLRSMITWRIRQRFPALRKEKNDEYNADIMDICQTVVCQFLTLVQAERLPNQHEAQARTYFNKIVDTRCIDFLKSSNRYELAVYTTENEEIFDGKVPFKGPSPEEEFAAKETDDTLKEVHQALKAGFDRALANRHHRWRPQMQTAWQIALELARSEITIDKLLVELGELAADAPEKERIRARDKALTAQKRLRNAILEVAEQWENEGETCRAELIRLAVKHLLRRRTVRERHPKAS